MHDNVKWFLIKTIILVFVAPPILLGYVWVLLNMFSWASVFVERLKGK